MTNRKAKTTEGADAGCPRIIVTSDLPVLTELAEWERAAVVPIALELLVPLVHGDEDDGEA